MKTVDQPIRQTRFSFRTANFPFICGNILLGPAYRVFISQLIRYARACRNYADFLYRARLFTNRLLEQDNVATRLKSSLQKFYGRHDELVHRYSVSICIMFTLSYNIAFLTSFVYSGLNFLFARRRVFI